MTPEATPESEEGSLPPSVRPGVDAWTTAEVVDFLKANGMGTFAPSFEESEVTGLDLILLTEDEIRSMLKITKLQAIKLKSLIAADPATAASDSAAAFADAATAADAAPEYGAGGSVPRVSERAEDYGDAAEQHDMARACSTTLVRPPEVPAAAAAAPVAAAAPPVAAVTEAMRGVTVTATLEAWAAAPPAVVLPTGTGALQLDAGTVAQFQQCVATVTALEREGVAQALPAARSKLESLKKRLKLQEEKFEELRQEEAKQDKKLDELVGGKWYPGKYLLGAARREDKISRNKGKLEDVSSKVEAAAAQLEELNAATTRAAGSVDELAAKCASLDGARGYCSSLLQSAFAGGAVGDARENALETEVAGLGPKIAEVRRYKTVYAQAHELMKQSRKALDQARQLLESASSLASVDVAANLVRPRGPGRGRFQPGPGNMMLDMVKRSQMRQGVQLCRVSADLALKARALVPDMPRVNTEKLQSLRAGFGLFDMAFSSVISDMIVARKIRGMLGEVRGVEGDITYAERWLQGWLSGRIDQDLRSMEAQLAARRTELHSHRMALLNAWIAARRAGAVAEAPPQPLGVAVGVPAGPPRPYVV